MTPKPSSAAHLAQILADAFACNEKIGPFDLAALNRVLEYTPEDMTVTVEAGITLAALQVELSRHRQWLPVDPPHPAQLTISDLINTNVSGPRRFGYGTVRDFLIGIKVALADGRIINSGGKVVKNVAGYDLAKLFIGSHGSLAVVIQTTFKLRPLPEMESFVQVPCGSLDQTDKFIEAVASSEITPVVLDLHALSPSNAGMPTLVLGFAGTREEVKWQLMKAHELGVNEPSSLDYETTFWTNPAPAHRLSILPSKMIAAIRGLNDTAFIARAGNGVVYHRGAPSPRQSKLPLELMRRVKDTYDPKQVLPGLPL